VTYLIGTDEAGFGPNLGPLVISAAVWQVPEGLCAGDLYRVLADTVAPSPSLAGATRVAIADSKALYQPGKGLHRLEAGLLAALAVLGRQPKCSAEVWETLAPESEACRRSISWYADDGKPVPLDATCEEIQRLSETLRDGLAATGVRLVEIRSRAVFEEPFNSLVERHASKGAALSHATLDLIAQLAQPLAGEPIAVTCDKHGGRNSYQYLLAEHFPEWLIEIYGESRERSVYRFGPAHRRMEVAFHAKAESFLPVALASMASKYLRELAMEALNTYWCGRVAGLKRTAGYPQDARRFKDEIAAVQAELGVTDRQLWRAR